MSYFYSTTIKQRKIQALIYSIFIFVVTVSIAFYVYYAQTQVLKNILAAQSEQTKINLTNNVLDLMSDLSSIAKRWVNDPDVSEYNWRADAQDFTDRIAGVNSVWFIDKDYQCLWVVSDSEGSQDRCEKSLKDTEYLLKLNAIKNNQNIDFTPVYETTDGQVIYLFKALGKGDTFGGYIALEAKFKAFIEYFLGNPENTGYYTKAFTDGKEVFSNSPELIDDSYVDQFSIDLDADGGAWVFKIYPTEMALDLFITELPYVIATAGCIIAILFMLTLWSKQSAKQESLKLVAEIEEKEKIQFDLEYLANHDTLTDLPNRYFITNFIEARVKFSAANKQKFTILFIDLDHFKDINDTLGHGVGDQMLKQLPMVFEQVFRQNDVVARMGGDEFVVYLPGEMNKQQVSDLVERFLKSLEYPIQINEHLIRLTGSVGVAFYPQHGSNVTELLSHADAALYRAKDKGRNTFSIYDSATEQAAKERMKLISRLHTANENDEFEMYFQPRFDLADNTILGAEALIRWNSEDRGVVGPASFLHLLEETSIIVSISYRMLAHSCVQFKKLHSINPDLFMSYNVSARLLEHPHFLKELKSILNNTQFPANRLELELTEQILIENVQNSQQILNEIKSMGIKVAIDDFGTGYSSLSYLKNFPVNVLKIDKSFILDIDSDSDDLELVKTMVSMGKNLNITTVAEGVETLAQLNLLKEQNCDQAQGYYFNKPMKFKDFYALIMS